ncbi:energy-coupled thiamine transporter ThiT [Marinisporobacter balticus]|uniref:Thiamine transporter n=1 Tax=Marinisporobacter balticus TaxID=2018667 RepID=A0A4R2KD13_9FIRM|nr:energy-coupled thiamine transporter ThiT [Marinisporobacter balticus]TCO71471.1 thiamine transporter [Marinisporobacter balticus]
MRKISTKMLVEAGIMIAVAQILSYVRVFELPNGGSVTAGSMVPILFYAIRWGVKPGMFVGGVYGILQLILGTVYSTHIVSLLFDYSMAFGLLGLAGLFRKSLAGVFLGVFIGIFGRFVSHVISGAIVFASYAPEGTNPWIYSGMYNASYLVPECIISVVVVGLLYKSFKRLPNL